MTTLLLTLIAFASSFISGLTGLGGGLLLVGFLSLFYPLPTVIALHGVLQIFSNFSRVIVMRQNIKWDLVWRYVILLAPGIYVGTLVVEHVNHKTVSVFLGLWLLYVVFKKKTSSAISSSRNIFIPVGFVTSFLSMIVGASGPILVSFLLNHTSENQEFIATKSTMQLFMQILKVIAFFSILNFNYQPYIQTLGIMVIFLFVGTYLANYFLRKISRSKLEVVVKALLIAIAIKLIIA